jgi:hypothetical protein
MANSKNLKGLEFRTEEELERLLLAGLNSGNYIEVDEAYWEKLRQRILDHQAKRPSE